MEFLLLGAGFVVLVAITLWIVWPSRTAEVVNTTVTLEEERASTDAPPRAPSPSNATLALPPTEATLALPPTVVALAPLPTGAGSAPSGLLPLAGGDRWLAGGEVAPVRALGAPLAQVQPRSVSLGTAALMSVGSAVGGAWLFSRWQREGAKPLLDIAGLALLGGVAYVIWRRLNGGENEPPTWYPSD